MRGFSRIKSKLTGVGLLGFFGPYVLQLLGVVIPYSNYVQAVGGILIVIGTVLHLLKK